MRVVSLALALLTVLVPGLEARAAAPSLPEIAHEPLEHFVAGSPVTLTAKIRSPAGRRVFTPTAFVRLAGIEGYIRVPMVASDGPDGFVARIPQGLTQTEFEYYLEAFDEDGNGPARLGSPKAPFRVRPIEPERPADSPPFPAKAVEAPRSASGWRVAGVAAVAGGVACLVGALASGGVALAAKGDMQKATTGAQFDRARNRADESAMAANVLGVVGGVAAATGAAFLLFAPSTTEPKVAVGFGGTPGSLGVTFSGTF